MRTIYIHLKGRIQCEKKQLSVRNESLPNPIFVSAIGIQQIRRIITMIFQVVVISIYFLKWQEPYIFSRIKRYIAKQIFFLREINHHYYFLFAFWKFLFSFFDSLNGLFIAAGSPFDRNTRIKIIETKRSFLIH